MIKPSILETLANEGIPIRHNKTRCVFHEDKTPSMVIYPATNSFYCFGCGEHGDSIDFIMKLRGMSFKQSLRYLQVDGYVPQAISTREVTRRHLINEFRTWEKSYYNHLYTLYRTIQRHKTNVTSLDDINESAYHSEALIEYRLDVLCYGNDQSKYDLFKEVANGYV